MYTFTISIYLIYYLLINIGDFPCHVSLHRGKCLDYEFWNVGTTSKGFFKYLFPCASSLFKGRYQSLTIQLVNIVSKDIHHITIAIETEIARLLHHQTSTTNQPTYQPTNPPTNEPANQPTNQLPNSPRCQATYLGSVTKSGWNRDIMKSLSLASIGDRHLKNWRKTPKLPEGNYGWNVWYVLYWNWNCKLKFATAYDKRYSI